MPIPTATGERALALTNLQAMVAKSATFQAWIGSPGDEAAALVRVKLGEVSDDFPKPCAVVWNEKSVAEQSGEGASFDFMITGGLVIQFLWEIDTPDDRDAAYVSMENAVGSIFTELLALAGSGAPCLNGRRWVVETVFRFPDADAAARSTDVYIGLIRVSYRP